MSPDRKRTQLRPGGRTPGDVRWAVDVVVLKDVEAFLAELGRFTGQLEAVVDRLADIIVDRGGPGGGDSAMAAWITLLLVKRTEHGGGLPNQLDLRDLVTEGLYAMQANLEACLDPAVGGGELSREAAGLLCAMIEPAARQALRGALPLTWRSLPIRDSDLRRIGAPLLGVRIAGHEPFRLVRAGAFAKGELPIGDRTIWNLLELARATSTSGDHGLVFVPHLESLDEIEALA